MTIHSGLVPWLRVTAPRGYNTQSKATGDLHSEIVRAGSNEDLAAMVEKVITKEKILLKQVIYSYLHFVQPLSHLLVLNRSGMTHPRHASIVWFGKLSQIWVICSYLTGQDWPSTPCFSCVSLQVAKRAKKHARVDLHIKAGQIGIRGGPGPKGYDGPKGFTGPRGNRVFCSVSHSRSFAECHQHVPCDSAYGAHLKLTVQAALHLQWSLMNSVTFVFVNSVHLNAVTD